MSIAILAVMSRRPPRLGNFSYQGYHRYHLRLGTFDGSHYFSDAALVCPARSELFRTAESYAMSVHVVCFMPDHVHVMVQGAAADADCREFVKVWKQRSAIAVSRRFKCRLWRPGFFDRVLRENEGAAIVARYILGNPVRAGLSTRIGEYPFAWCVWGSDVIEGDEM
jgi:putative transposase